MELALALACLIQAAPVIPLRAATPGTFAATPVCGAGHSYCEGRATLYLPTEFGSCVLAEANVRAGERFELVLHNAPLCARQWDELSVDLRLEGHLWEGIDSPPIREGCDLGRWRVPPIDPAELRCCMGWSSEPRVGPRSVRLELRGGDARDALAGFTIPDDLAGPGLRGLSSESVVSPTYGVHRVDRRIWEIDLDRLGVQQDRFRVIVHTLSGANRAVQVEKLTAVDGAPQLLVFQAPERVSALRGRVVDAEGKPVAAAQVGCTTLAANSLQLALTDTDGRFELDGLANGEFWVSVNDRRWRSRRLWNLFAPVVAGGSEPVLVTVDRQRWIQIDPSDLRLDGDTGLLIAVGRRNGGVEGSELASVVALEPAEARAAFRIPACWGDAFTVYAVPMPEEGREPEFDLAAWIKSAAVARAAVSFPAGDKGAVTRFVRPKRR